ncbi:MAG: FliO/MopB family protein [Limisphaerales bacterium]
MRQSFPTLSQSATETVAPGESSPESRPTEANDTGPDHRPTRSPFRTRGAWFGLLILASGFALGAETAFGDATPDTDLPSIGPSLARVLGAFAFVLLLFFGGVWVTRNWRRFGPRSAGIPDLRVLEVRSLGGRQSIFVVGYRNQRMLLASAPTGVTLLSHLPEAEVEVEVAASTGSRVTDESAVGVGDRPDSGVRVAQPDFAAAFRQMLARRL